MKPLILFKNNSENQWKQDRLKNLNSNINLSNFLVKSNYLEINDIELFTNNYNLNESKKVVIGAKKAQKGTILISTVRPTRGAICELKENIYVSNALLQINTNNYFFNKFLLQLFLQNNFIIKLNELCEGGTYPTVKKENILNLEIFYPKNEVELQSIASFFYNFDSLILREQIKLKQLKNIKKAMLEKMFPKENSNVPELRFKGFTETWEQRKCIEIAEYSKGSGYSKSDLAESGTPLILYGRLYTKYQFVINEIDTYAEIKKGAVLSKGNEVIVPASGETAEDIARATAVVKSGVLLGGDLNILRPFNFINPLFLALAISNGKSQKELSKKAQGKSVVHIHNSDIKEVEIVYPSKYEQIKIINMFQTLDHLITLHQYKYDKLVQVKKALLNKMFV